MASRRGQGTTPVNMIEYYKPKHFKVHELVPQKVFIERGEKALQLLDNGALITRDKLRSVYGQIKVNDYEFGGIREWSGLRTQESPYGTRYSQHRFGRAFDCIFLNTNADIVRQDILKNPDSFPFITSIELGTSWLHFDTRNCERIMTYRP